MNDSDDNYFTDDLVLDDKTLAVLDEQESKFKRTTNSQSQRSAGPPPKRQRTTSSLWQPQSVGRTLHRADTLEDMEVYPDVSIRQDGTYNLHDRQRRPLAPPSRSGVAPGPNVLAQTGSGTRHTTTAPLSRGSARVTRAPSRPPSVARSTRVTQSPASSQEVSRPQSGPPQRVNRVPSTTAPANYVGQLLRQIEEVWYFCSASAGPWIINPV